MNYFKTSYNKKTSIGLSSRGATTSEKERQIQKLANAILSINTDLIGLVEIENDFDESNDGSTAIETLVNAVNKKYKTKLYDYVYPNQRFVGGDAIAVAFIYKPSKIQINPKSKIAVLDDKKLTKLPAFKTHNFKDQPIFSGPNTNRSPLAINFIDTNSKINFDVVLNHFKSKGTFKNQKGKQDSHGNIDLEDGAGAWNLRRTHASRAVIEWMKTHPTEIDTKNVVLMGDLNAYPMEDPIQTLLKGGFNNPLNTQNYSYVYKGQYGLLDYIMVSDALLKQLSSAEVLHINADEAKALDYKLSYRKPSKYFNSNSSKRSSDHDPVIYHFRVKPKGT